MHGMMDAWMVGYINAWIDARMDARTHGCTHAWMDAWVGGRLIIPHGFTGLKHSDEAGEENHACRTVGI